MAGAASGVILSEMECKGSDIKLSWPFISLISVLSAIVLHLGGCRGTRGDIGVDRSEAGVDGGSRVW